MFTKLSLFLLACLAVSVIGQGSSCSESEISRPLIRECSNAARENSRLIDGGCFSSVGSVPPLRSNAALEAAAQAHAVDMARTGIYDHEGSDGSSPGERAVTHGYIPSRWAENIHRGQGSALAAVRGWLCSSTHRDHLLSRDFDEFGIGHACGSRGCFHVQLFGCSTGSNCAENAPPVVPVNPPSSPVATNSPAPVPQSPQRFSLTPSPVQTPPPPSPTNSQPQSGNQPPNSFEPTNSTPKQNSNGPQQNRYYGGNQGSYYYYSSYRSFG